MTNTKSKIVTLRVTDDELKTIKERAEKAGLTVSRFLVESATAGTGLSVSQKQQAYWYLCQIKDAAEHQRNYENAKESIFRWCDSLCQLLK